MEKNAKRTLCCLLSIFIYMQSHGCYSTQEQERVQSLSLDKKIGQLLMVGAVATPQKPSVYTEEAIKKFIEQYHIGGIIYLGRSTPEEQLSMTQRLQAHNKQHNPIDLWLGLDAEWGPAMRLDNTIKFPFNLTLGAIQNVSLIQELGYMIGKQLQELGTSADFAPVADTNTNPDNPIINRRSFGQDPTHVAILARAYACGLARAGIMACGKHFPGHGDTSVDSHLGLPSINHDLQRIKSVELVPFKHLIAQGIPSIMVGHLLIPAYDKENPATLSYAITTDLLKKECGFNGLVITDGLNMHGVTDIFEPGVIEVKALQAGADLLLIPSDVDKAFACIKQAVLDGHISQEELDEHVLKIIHAKNIYKPTRTCSPDKVTEALNCKEAQELSRLLYQEAITIVRDDNSIPLTASNGTTTVITIGLDTDCPFVTTLNSAHPITPCATSQSPAQEELDAAFATASKADTVIIGLAGLSYQPHTNYGTAPQTVAFIKTLQELHKQLILVLFGNPYALKLFNDIPTLVEAYEDHPYAQQAAAKVLLGTIHAEGKLPIEA
jgi:beta-glucosidase-like glycosyl hydrolase